MTQTAAPDPWRPFSRTPLHGLHLKLGARMVPFCGYELPVQYPGGIIAEHTQTRTHAGLFDVSHMGQVRVRPSSSMMEDVCLALERLTPANIVDLPEGRQRYALLTAPDGGILDDIMVARKTDHLLLVVNASRRSQDFSLIQSSLEDIAVVEMVADRALIALQGPASANCLERLLPGAGDLTFMETSEFEYAGETVWVSRSGYTGEDGYEVSVPSHDATRLANELLAMDPVQPAGLGSRDSLRLEAGLRLYGNDIDESTSPVEAGLDWTIPAVRRYGGAREGGFPGEDRIFADLADGTGRSFVGIRPQGRAPVRGGALLFAGLEDTDSIGKVTSGGFGPTIGGPVAMGYVAAASSALGTTIFAEVRGRRMPAEIQPLPFVEHRFRRQKRSA